MFSLYNLLKFLHILAVIVWMGGMLVMVILSTRFRQTRDPAVMRALSEHGRFLGMTVFGPSVGIALITGIGMVQVGRLSFGAFWITWGMTGLVLSLILGGALAGRMAAKLSKQVAAGEIDAETVAATQGRIALVGILNLLVLASVVFVMVFKP